ncbi:glycosyltransferase [Patescibacteria group bacterium]|nr:glycosyltransferase [Patescibacteria group bacterium]
MTRFIRFSLIIPTTDLDRRELLIQTLSLVDGAFSGNQTEVIIVENGIKKEKANSFFKRLKEQYPRLKIKNFSLARRSASQARNLGVKKSKGNWLVFLDDDCLLTKNWPKEIKRLSQLPSGEIFQGRIIHQFEEKNLFVDIFLFWLEFSRRISAQGEIEKPTKLLHIGNAMFKKKIFKSLDYVFDETLFPFVGEEADLAARLLKNGVSILYVPKLTVRHIKKTRTLGDTFKKAFLYGRKEGILTERYPLDLLAQQALGQEINKLKKQIGKKNRRIFFRLLKKWLSGKSLLYKIGFVFFLLLRQLFFWLGFIYGRIFYKFYQSFKK